jgi:hypothetical protein
VLQGRAAASVIDDLEALFLRRYEDYRAGHQVPSAADGQGGD